VKSCAYVTDISNSTYKTHTPAMPHII